MATTAFFGYTLRENGLAVSHPPPSAPMRRMLVTLRRVRIEAPLCGTVPPPSGPKSPLFPTTPYLGNFSEKPTLRPLKNGLVIPTPFGRTRSRCFLAQGFTIAALRSRYRTHAGLEGRLPEQIANGRASAVQFASYRWESHCRGLYQTYVAA